MGMKNKSCEVEQISTPTLKEIIATCLETITCIVKMLLTRGDFIADWKLTIVRPLLKKTWLQTSTQELQTCLKPILPLQAG